MLLSKRPADRLRDHAEGLHAGTAGHFASTVPPCQAEGSKEHAWQAEIAALMPHGWEIEHGMAAANRLRPLLE